MRPKLPADGGVGRRLQLLVGKVEQPNLEVQRGHGLVAGVVTALFEKHAVVGPVLRHGQFDERSAGLLQPVVARQNARQPIGQPVEQQAIRGVGVIALQPLLVMRLGEPAGGLADLGH